ncbi:hypothetical protein AAF712_015770 [Marasmius tenuissimus]|uniref:Protein kinase domain-containing protein n=1 Tax=Marasmius tenuissimus TaxID=585030 RepID=A0ABR2Z8F3_9AGAR
MAREGSTYHQTFNNNGGSTNYNNTGNGSQNWYEGKTFHQNTGSGQILIVTHGGQGASDDDDDDDDELLSPEELQKELKIYHQRPTLNDDELRKIADSQEYLDNWQRLIISDLAGDTLTLDGLTDILDVMIRLSKISGLSPKCLRIQDVGIEILGRPLDVQSADVEVYKGKVGTQDVIVKALKKERPHDEQLKAADSFNKFAEGVIDGLIHIHNQDIIHGGLRNPSSFLIHPPDRSCIADLGLAQLLSDEGDDGSQDSDMFQCARTLYKKLYGCRRLKNPPSRPPHVTDTLWDKLEAWLKKGLAVSQATAAEGSSRDNDT